VRKDGSSVSVLLGAAFLDEAQQEGVAFVLDISERKELERRKDDFLSMVSHELKTPLSNIWILTHLLTKQLTEQELQDPSGNLSLLGTQARQLMKMLTDVLEVSQLEAGYVLYTEEAFDFNLLVQQVVTTLQQVSPDHAIVVTGTVDRPVIGDRERLGQVLTNLLTNAIKYSVGTDKIDVVMTSTDEMLTICVRDYGVGIPPEQQHKLFERFYRAPNSRRATQPGFGMGLYISQEIIKRHRGTIEVESAEGKGSTFIVTLPLTR
jgi:signal transduction histidine kinase